MPAWTIQEAHLEVGELHRKPHLCQECQVTVMAVLLAVLKPIKVADVEPKL